MSYGEGLHGPVFSATFSSVSLSTNPYDLFGIKAPSNSRVQVVGMVIALKSTDNTKEQNLTMSLLRGSTASSTSAAITAQNMMGWAGTPTAGSSVTQPSSTLVSTTSAVSIWEDTWNCRDAFMFPRDDVVPRSALPILDKSQRLHLRVSAPSTGTTFVVSGSILFREIGQPPA